MRTKSRQTLARKFHIETFHMTHSIPDSIGLAITTPAGLIVVSGDYKFDPTPIDNWPSDFAKLAELGTRNVLALFSDSTNSERPEQPLRKKISIKLSKKFLSTQEVGSLFPVLHH